MIEAINPATGEVIGRYDPHGVHDVELAIDRAEATFHEWRRLSLEARAARVRALGALLRERQAELGRLATREMGKPIKEARAEVEKCAWVCEHYAEHGPALLAPERVETEATRSFVTFQPLGVVLAIMPWNFPFWQLFRFAAPALLAGNTVLLKHAANVPGCALAIERVVRDAGFPEGALKTLLIESHAVEGIIASPHVAAVTLTGSVRAGRAVAAQAGAQLKKTVLELGGSDAYVVLEDADVEQAAAVCAKSRLINSGQSCIAAKRFVVVEAVAERFEAALIERLAAARVGDPEREETEVGPLARGDLRRELHAQVAASVEAGARCALGGELPRGPGYFYPPTVLLDVPRASPAASEELFGPVAAVLRARDEAAALHLANASVFGLGGAVFTRDRARGERIAAEELAAGCCFVNDFVRSDPRLPFGGIKESGYGRELGREGIREFTNIKTVWVK